MESLVDMIERESEQLVSLYAALKEETPLLASRRIANFVSWRQASKLNKTFGKSTTGAWENTQDPPTQDQDHGPATHFDFEIQRRAREKQQEQTMWNLQRAHARVERKLENAQSRAQEQEQVLGVCQLQTKASDVATQRAERVGRELRERLAQAEVRCKHLELQLSRVTSHTNALRDTLKACLGQAASPSHGACLLRSKQAQCFTRLVFLRWLSASRRTLRRRRMSMVHTIATRSLLARLCRRLAAWRRVALRTTRLSIARRGKEFREKRRVLMAWRLAAGLQVVEQHVSHCTKDRRESRVAYEARVLAAWRRVTQRPAAKQSQHDDSPERSHSRTRLGGNEHEAPDGNGPLVPPFALHCQLKKLRRQLCAWRHLVSIKSFARMRRGRRVVWCAYCNYCLHCVKFFELHSSGAWQSGRPALGLGRDSRCLPRH